MKTPALDLVQRYRLRFVGRGHDLLPVEDGEVYAADSIWVRLSHAERAEGLDLAAAVAESRADAIEDERRRATKVLLWAHQLATEVQFAPTIQDMERSVKRLVDWLADASCSSAAHKEIVQSAPGKATP